MTARSPLVAGLCSLVLPGLGQLYNGERPKGIATLCISVGIWVFFILSSVGPSRSHVSQLLLGVTYVFVWIPAAWDAYQQPGNAPRSLISGSSAWYVVLMVLMVGVMAIPLVWQSPRLSRTAKWVWSAIGLLNTVAALALLFFAGAGVERWLDDLRSTDALFQ